MTYIIQTKWITPHALPAVVEKNVNAFLVELDAACVKALLFSQVVTEREGALYSAQIVYLVPVPGAEAQPGERGQ